MKIQVRFWKTTALVAMVGLLLGAQGALTADTLQATRSLRSGTSPLAAVADTVINLVQWSEGTGGNGHWYAVLPGERYWVDANALVGTLEQEGMTGYLATVTSPEENEFIFSSVIAGTNQPSILDMFWLGGRDTGGAWQWLTGESFVYTNWSTGEPNNQGIETALGMWGHHQTHPSAIPGMWNNALPDPTVNPHAQFWAVVEWGVPDSLPLAVCGNGILEWGEDCDDGNLIAGDGCDPSCQVEGGTQPDDTLINLVQWQIADGGNDHWYAVLTGEKYWVDADAMAATLEHDALTGYLATVTSPEENAFILAHVVAGTNQPSVLDMFWLAGRDLGLHWVWLTGEPFVYTNWSTGEPNNIGIETALGMWGPNVTDPRRIPGMWNNSLPDPTVNPLARFWAVVEWGIPDTTLPDPVCGNGILEWGEECDDGNLVAGDGCDPACLVEVEPEPDDELINLVQWLEADGGNDHWYAVLTGEDYWVDAHAKMDTLLHGGEPGYLATVTTPAENDFILNEVISGTNQPSILDEFWLGGARYQRLVVGQRRTVPVHKLVHGRTQQPGHRDRARHVGSQRHGSPCDTRQVEQRVARPHRQPAGTLLVGRRVG